MKGLGFLLLLALKIACDQGVVFDYSQSSGRVGVFNGGDEGNQVGLHEPIINRLAVIEQVSILDDQRVSLIMVFQVLLASAHNASRPGGSEYKLPDHSPQHLFKTEVQ